MTPGRPKEFDRDAALETAVEVFWEKGYAATSVDELLARMAIGRQSLYDTFGDKEALFCEAIQYYQRAVAGRLGALLEAEGSPLGNIRNLFDTLVSKFGDGSARGCLVVNASIEFAGGDPQSAVLKSLGSTFNALERALRSALERAVEAGELPSDFAVTQWATFLVGNMQGMLIMAKTGGSREALQCVADGALTTIGA